MSVLQTVDNFLNRFRRQHPRLLVVGPPRSGFTLLLSIISQILDTRRFRHSGLREALQAYIAQASQEIYSDIQDYFSGYMDSSQLVISPEFQLLVGGPKWLRSDAPDMASVRKYIGIKKRGDFLAVLTFPKVAMDYYRIIHSHSHPDRWLQDDYYRYHIKFASIRNPLDILNSATFSLNALTGDYIDHHIHADSNEVREKLGLYKLTDLNFIEGLINPLLDYLKAFLPVKERYHVMHWEDLITEPASTIGFIAQDADLPLTRKRAEAMWEAMKFQNQTAHHRHNFRKGIIGDWKNHFLNEHLDIIKGSGIEHYTKELGYGPIEYLDRDCYTPFQRRIESYVKAGRIWDQFEDPDLFMFAFNKSNFRSDKYDFVGYQSNGLVDIERSSFKDERLLRGFMDRLHKKLQPINDDINDIYRRFGP